MFLYSLVIFSQDCQINLTIPSGSYEVFDDNFELIDNDIVLLPILSDGDIAISSFQLNLEFNHQQLEINDELIGVINNSEFYSLNNISPSSFDVSSGGFYSSNTAQIDSVTSVFSIAFATSFPQPSVDVLMYIPLIFNDLECSDIKFTNGYIDEQFVFPNQTFETLVSNQDVSNCNQDGLICIELTPDILGCTDSDACNYDINANLSDDSCVYNGESCYVVVASDCCCCGLCMCVCENFLDSNYTCEFFITGEDSNNVVVQGQIENCECSLGQLEGCTDENACNYDELSIVDNDSCLYPNNGSDCDGNCLDEYVLVEGECIIELTGCTDPLACNYSGNYNSDDGSCFYPNDCGDCTDQGLQQSIELPQGWSLFSTYICPFNPSFEFIMADLVENNMLTIIKDDMGSVYWPEFGINTVGDIQNGKGYLIKVLDNYVLDISGSSLNFDYPISIPEGWSYIGYLHQDTYLLEDMFQSINTNIMIIKDSQGNVYWPLFEINAIETMSPGQAFQINLYEEELFSYPSANNVGRFSSKNFEFSEINSGNNMTLGIPSNVWSDELSENDVLKVFDQNNSIVGYSNYRPKGTVITLWGNDETTIEKDGLDVGEEFIISLYRDNSNVREDIIVKNWKNGEGFYSVNGISIVGSIEKGINSKKIIQISDVIGRNINPTSSGVIFYIYDDGSVEKKLKIK